MKISKYLLGLVFLTTLITACGNSTTDQTAVKIDAHGAPIEAEVVKGPHGGRMLVSGDFSLELAIFETGVPPEFRAWASFKGKQLLPNEVELNIVLTRLSDNEAGRFNKIKFKPQGDAMRGDTVIYEPHSFIVTINAEHNGNKHAWQYDNFEGRTKIEKAVAEALEIKTSIAGPIVLQETVSVFGKIKTNTEGVSHVNARFAGVIKSISVSVGDIVRKGQVLAKVESNESLKVYSIRAPINGVVTQRKVNAGEQTGTHPLFTITDTSTVWIDLSVFPSDRQRVRVGANVKLDVENISEAITGKISMINVTAEANQSVIARAVIDNKDGKLLPGRYIKAQITVGEHPVPLAVKRTGLQAFRDFTVVYAQIGDEYEVRMLELGKKNSEWVEVLGGLEAGTRYVSENSYVIKADIEKTGASHDH